MPKWNGAKLDTNRHLVVCDNEACVWVYYRIQMPWQSVKFYRGGVCSSENPAKEIIVMTIMIILQEINACPERLQKYWGLDPAVSLRFVLHICFRGVR